MDETGKQMAFTLQHRIGLLILSVVLLLLVLELVRRRRFKERYALLWMGSAFLGLLMGAFPGIIVWSAHVLHVQFLTVFYVMSFVFLLGMVLGFSVVISELTERNRELAQELALLSERLHRLEKSDDCRKR